MRIIRSQPEESGVQNPFTAEIELKEDPDEGLRIECLAPHAEPLRRALEAAGFTTKQPQVVVDATRNIPAFVEIPVNGGSFDEMKTAVQTSLLNGGVNVTEETFFAPGEKHVRLNLENIHLYGR